MKKKLVISSFFAFVTLGLFSWKYTQPTFQGNHSDIKLLKVNVIDADSNKLYCPDDMEVTLWAESPMLYNPTNMDIDIKGRVWITEAVNYREFKNKPDNRLNHEKGERVMILEDTNQDGKADKSTVFVEDKDLISPLGIAIVGNKVYVSAAPNLVVYTDENGDDKADKKEIFLTGFGGKDHDHSLHSGVMTPDGQFFFNVGNAGPHIVTDKAGWTLRAGSLYTGGTPWNKENHGNQVSDDGRVWVGGLAMKIGKDGKGLKVLGHNFRNSYEVAMDSYGNMWQNDNDDQVIACRTSFLMENGNAGYFSNDGTRAWQADRRPGQDMFTASWHQDDPGIMPACDNTGAGSPTGGHFYEGDAFGDKYRGMLLSCEAGRNVIFNYFPKQNGAGFDLKRNDLVSSQGVQSSEKYDWYDTGKDQSKWFRPSDICAGTDGSIFIADWYDPIVGGHSMQDKIGYGRIYRLTPKNKKLNTPTIDISTTQGQIEALKNPAQNVRYQGFEALVAGGQKSIEAVKDLLNSENPFHRARAIWLMAQLGDSGRMEVENLLKSQNENTRLVAFRALRGQTKDVLVLCEKMVSDSSPAVRREVAIALRDIPFEKCKGLIICLIKQYNGQDAWLLEAIGTASDRKETQVYEAVKSLNLPEDFTQKITWRLHPVNAVADLKNGIEKSNTTEKSRAMLLTALSFVKDKTAAEAMISLSKSPLKDVSEQARWWVNFRKTNDWVDMMNWEAVANEILTPNMKKMMEYKVQLRDKKLTESDKIKIAKMMAKDPDGGNFLVDMKAVYQLDDKIVKAISEDIFNNPDAKVRILASQFFPRNGKPLKLDFVARMGGDLEKGKTTFATYCATCHRHGENGNDIGPDLTNIHKKFDKLGLLDAIINPSASMVFGFESYSIVTKKGKSYFGFLLGDDGKNITIKDAAGQKSVIKVADIKTKEKMPNSLMPDPTAMGLKEQELADLSSYLLSFK
jgi:putative membrane-bound dehydrogenase-like protein